MIIYVYIQNLPLADLCWPEKVCELEGTEDVTTVELDGNEVVVGNNTYPSISSSPLLLVSTASVGLLSMAGSGVCKVAAVLLPVGSTVAVRLTSGSCSDGLPVERLDLPEFPMELLDFETWKYVKI